MKILNLFFLSLCSLFMIACLDPIDIESNILEAETMYCKSTT